MTKSEQQQKINEKKKTNKHKNKQKRKTRRFSGIHGAIKRNLKFMSSESQKKKRGSGAEKIFKEMMND